MARRQAIIWTNDALGDKPLSGPMMAKVPTHIYASLGLNALIEIVSGYWFS